MVGSMSGTLHSVLCLAAWGDEIFIAVYDYMVMAEREN